MLLHLTVVWAIAVEQLRRDGVLVFEQVESRVSPAWIRSGVRGFEVFGLGRKVEELHAEKMGEFYMAQLGWRHASPCEESKEG
ncbi:MAG: hypothetical protein A3F68_11300 [Acidobacteria bacterium RIFCSPLOWO2_12_FULL_54_10]|nr:MAG: hypothetical protein A3F68_11300 [Acidobacteria bacterium RIFCSPLOWO2_12_FULL_54_10]